MTASKTFSLLKQQAGSRSSAVVFLAKESIQSELMESTTVEAAEIGQMPSNHTNQPTKMSHSTMRKMEKNPPRRRVSGQKRIFSTLSLSI